MRPEGPQRFPGLCYDPETLAAYSVGKLPPEQVQVITAHVAGCGSCARTLDDLTDGDTLVAALRHHLGAGPAADEFPAGSSADSAIDPVRPDGATPQDLDPPPSRAYDLLEVIGRGAMGVVYRARQVSLNRLVALKMARPDGLLPPEEWARYRTEGEAIARLDHPGIVRVYECGELRGRPFVSMELVEGQSLAQKLEGGPLPEGEAAELVRALALAVSFAHRKGVIHRDLKPANVLLAADGPVKLADFGLAKLLDVEAGQTQRDTILGTAGYMAPEQARGDVAAVGPLADVYGLGAILYEALTGRPPFRSATRAETLQQVQAQDPTPPSRLRPRLCHHLEAVCLKCLEKAPSRRYPSATALAEDLGRWIQDRNPLARPAGRLRRSWKAIRRRPLRVAGVLAGVLAIAAAGLAWNVLESRPERIYERRVAPLLAQLQRGETVELIQPGGEAPAFLVRCGEGITKARMTADGFTVMSPALGLVELLPRVPVSHYQLAAEFSHNRSQFGPVGDSGVGVTFTGRHIPSAEGGQHVVAAVALDDWDTVWQGKRRGRAMLQLVWYLDTPTDSQSPYVHQICYPPKQSAWYAPPTGPEGILHTLEINAAPEGATAVLGDSPGQKMGPLEPWIFPWFANELRKTRKEVKGTELDPLNRPAIGVLVSGGQCTIRRLRIVPRPEATQ